MRAAFAEAAAGFKGKFMHCGFGCRAPARRNPIREARAASWATQGLRARGASRQRTTATSAEMASRPPIHGFPHPLRQAVRHDHIKAPRSPGGGCAAQAQRLDPCGSWTVGLFGFRAPPLDSPKTPVFPLIAARPCSARDFSTFHSLDEPHTGRQGGGVRKRPSDRLRRRPSRGPLSPLVGDTY